MRCFARSDLAAGNRSDPEALPVFRLQTLTDPSRCAMGGPAVKSDPNPSLSVATLGAGR